MRRRRLCAVLTSCVLALASAGCAGSRTGTLAFAPLAGVAKVTVVDTSSEHDPPVRITNRRQVRALTAFMNSRRDGWYTAPDNGFSAPIDLTFFNGKGVKLTEISVGPCGMYQLRSDSAVGDALQAHDWACDAPSFFHRRVGYDSPNAIEVCRLLGPVPYGGICTRMMGRPLGRWSK
jgi:hypothetical protein